MSLSEAKVKSLSFSSSSSELEEKFESFEGIGRGINDCRRFREDMVMRSSCSAPSYLAGVTNNECFTSFSRYPSSFCSIVDFLLII